MNKPLINLVTGIAIGVVGATGYFLLSKPANPYVEGLTLMQKSKFEAASNSFLEALEANPENIAARIALGSANQSMGKEEEALKQYEMANTSATNVLTQFYSNLGVLYQKKQNSRAAQSAYAKLAAFQVKSVDASYNQAMAAAAHGANHEALSEFDKVLSINPKHAAAAFQAGRVAEKMGDKEKAVEYYQTALRADLNLKAAQDRLKVLNGGRSKAPARTIASSSTAPKRTHSKTKKK